MKKIKEVIKEIRPLDTNLMEEAQKRLDKLTKPQGSLGKLEDFAKRIVGITGKINPVVERKIIFTMAGDHGVAQEGVSAFPQEVTSQMVYNFIRGGAGINVLARHIGAKVVVVDMGVNHKFEIRNSKFKNKKVNFGTKNIAQGPAMSREEAVRSIEAGIDIFEEELTNYGIDIIGVGDMGIANTTPSSAICACITQSKVEDVTGKGTGISDEQLNHKIRVIEKALEINSLDPKDPIDVLAKVGGFEIGGLTGCVLASASHRIPVVLDGFISTAGALLANELCPRIKEYLIASHVSVEIGHKIVLNRMGLQPIFNLRLRLGEGTGAALGITVIEACVKILTEMATFDEAGVSERK